MGSGDARLDVARVRGQFPGLSDGLVHTEGPRGTLVPENVVHAITQAMRVPVAPRGGVFPASARAEGLVAGARAALADLTGGVPAGVVLGASATALTYVLAGAVARTWRPGDEIVVSRLDHDANIRPWVQMAERRGVHVRWAEVDIETGELPAWQYDELLTPRTRLVAVTAASSAIGTRPDVAAIAARAHGVGALVVVDAVHAAAHHPVDRLALGADLLTVSAYKWCGPHVGAVVADPEVLAGLWPDKLRPAPDRVPDRFEIGGQPFPLYAGVAAAVDHLAGLAGEAAGSRRERLLRSMAAVAAYEGQLFGWLDQALRAMRHVTVLGAADDPTPVLSFTVAGMRPRQVTADLARRGICAWDGDQYARELFDAIGASEHGGAVGLGLMHYNTAEEVGYVIDAVAALRPR
ncbi:cysteine desulfurase-like protein [Trujillonella humicola]|uniref:cysteine desulfurase-like protein n=1 Tax=Trujillonella humicola TaxID=3383699 RepID=UPI0039067ED8